MIEATSTGTGLLAELRRLYAYEAAFAGVRAAIEDDCGLWTDGQRLARVRELVEAASR